jgi:hypothetical protein
VIDTVEIWRMAATLVISHKGEAPKIAARKALDLRDSGDGDGFNLWKCIGTAVMELERARPRPDELIQ